MADRRALIVAADKYLDPALAAVPYAEAGAKAVSAALDAAGYPKANQVVLLGSQATKTVVESRLRRLVRDVKPGDTVLVYVNGLGFTRTADDLAVLTAWDTQADDLADTGLPIDRLVAQLEATPAEQVVLLLDVGRPDDRPDDPDAEWEPHLEPAAFGFLSDSPKTVCLTAADAYQASHAAAALKGSLWTHHVVAALSGRAAGAIGKDGRVTADTLHASVEDELPRLLRKHFEGKSSQTPKLFGPNAAAVIADLGPKVGRGPGEQLLDPDRLKRVVFRSDSTGRVKDLTGWRKTFALPDSDRPSARKFVAKVAAADLKADLDQVFEAAREHLGYKRKDLDLSAGSDGYGYLRTPDFEYAVTVGLNPEDPTEVTWRREVGQFADPGFVRGDGFDAVFGKLFDQLAFEFAEPVDVAALVDRLEDRPPKGAKVSVASDGRSCDVSLAGFAGRVTIDSRSLTVRGRAGSAGLLDQFLAFVRAVGPLGEPLALPPGH